MRALRYVLGHLRLTWLLLFADDAKANIPLAHFRQTVPIEVALLAVRDVATVKEQSAEHNKKTEDTQTDYQAYGHLVRVCVCGG